MLATIELLCEEGLDRFEAVVERLIAQFRPEEAQPAMALLLEFRTARREIRPLAAAHRALASALKAGALKVVTAGGGWELRR